METIKPGMTRAELLKVFRTEGGLSTARRRTYVFVECIYFKVDVEFEAAGGTESNGDIIKSISRPYIRRPILD